MGQGARGKRQEASWQVGKRQVGKRQPSDYVGHICQFASCYLLLASLHNPSHKIWNYKKESCYGICIQNEN